MRFLCQQPAARSVILLLTALSHTVVALPQVTVSNAIYLTDPALGSTTFTESLVAVTNANGLLTTVSVGALTTSTAATATTTSAVTTNSLGPAAETVYSYTTVDGNGNTVVVTDTFTPTYQPTVYPTSYLTGTIIAWSDWTAVYATATAKSSAEPRRPFEGASSALWSGAASLLALLAGGGAVALL